MQNTHVWLTIYEHGKYGSRVYLNWSTVFKRIVRVARATLPAPNAKGSEAALTSPKT
jgi:hypothetical protein